MTSSTTSSLHPIFIAGDLHFCNLHTEISLLVNFQSDGEFGTKAGDYDTCACVHVVGLGTRQGWRIRVGNSSRMVASFQARLPLYCCCCCCCCFGCRCCCCFGCRCCCCFGCRCRLQGSRGLEVYGSRSLRV